MPSEFCDHLADYGNNWIRAEASYGALTAAIDRILDQGATDSHLDLLEVSLGEWEYEVKQLRERFVALVKQGAVEVPATGEAEGSVCKACGFAVPKLTWPEWNVQTAGRPRFRGAELPAPQPA